MNIEFIIENIKSFDNETAIVTDGVEYKYSDLIKEYENSLQFLNDNGVLENSVVSLRGEFTPHTIGMMLVCSYFNNCKKS